MTWSVTQIASVDITRKESRGFVVGLNEFSGYFGVAVGGILVSYMTYLFSIKIGLHVGLAYTFILIALLYCIFLIEDTKKYANIELMKIQKIFFFMFLGKIKNYLLILKLDILKNF